MKLWQCLLKSIERNCLDSFSFNNEKGGILKRMLLEDLLVDIKQQSRIRIE